MLAAAAAVAFAAPAYADPTLPDAVPDPGSRPAPAGALRLPGSPTAPTAPAAPLPAAGNGPLATQVSALQIEVATLADQLLSLEETHSATANQLAVADQTLRAARTALATAQEVADAAAGDALKDDAGLPPGVVGSDLHDLGALSRIQRGDRAGGDTSGPVRVLNRAREVEQAAHQAYLAAEARNKTADTQFATAQSTFRGRETALVKLRQENEKQLIEVERLQERAEQRLGDEIGTEGVAGMVANPRAIAAVRYAMAQRGDPYLWAAEGPDRFDCSGLMWAAYRSKGANYFQLPRVAKDQYKATSARTVDRAALLPGDLVFFASGSHWSTVYHVGMYIGGGKMVHAPSSGDVVRVATVRWSGFYRATRIFEPVKAPTTPAPTKPAPTKPPTPAPTTPPPESPPPSTSPTPSPAPEPTTPEPTTPEPEPTTPQPIPPPPATGPATDPPATTSAAPSGSGSAGPGSASSTAGASSSGRTPTGAGG